MQAPSTAPPTPPTPPADHIDGAPEVEVNKVNLRRQGRWECRGLDGCVGAWAGGSSSLVGTLGRYLIRPPPGAHLAPSPHPPVTWHLAHTHLARVFNQLSAAGHRVCVAATQLRRGGCGAAGGVRKTRQASGKRHGRRRQEEQGRCAERGCPPFTTPGPRCAYTGSCRGMLPSAPHFSARGGAPSRSGSRCPPVSSSALAPRPHPNLRQLHTPATTPPHQT